MQFLLVCVAIKSIKRTAVFPIECSPTVVFSLLYSKEEQNTHSNNVFLIGSQAVPFTKSVAEYRCGCCEVLYGWMAEQKPGRETFI